MLAGFGVMAMDCSVRTDGTAVTLTMAEPETVPSVAVTPKLPAAVPVNRPAGALALQVTEPVMFAVDASLYVPVATNCCVPPTKMLAGFGVTAMDTSVTAGTIRFHVKVMVVEVGGIAPSSSALTSTAADVPS